MKKTVLAVIVAAASFSAVQAQADQNHFSPANYAEMQKIVIGSNGDVDYSVGYAERQYGVSKETAKAVVEQIKSDEIARVKDLTAKALAPVVAQNNRLIGDRSKAAIDSINNNMRQPTYINTNDVEHVGAASQTAIDSMNNNIGKPTAIDTNDAEHVGAASQAAIDSMNANIGKPTAIDTNDAEHVGAASQTAIDSMNANIGKPTAIDTYDADHQTAAGNPTPVDPTEYRQTVSAKQAAAAGNPAPVNATDYRETVAVAQATQAGNPNPVDATTYRANVNQSAANQKQAGIEKTVAANTVSAQEANTHAAQNSARIDSDDQAIAANSARIDSADQNIAANKAAAKVANDRASLNSAAIANHEERIEGLEQSTNSKFADLNKQVDDNRKRASAGIAGVAAMANIPQVIQGQTFSVGAGVGNTDGESALAVGMSARAGENVVVKTSVSNDTQHNFVVGAGVSYGW
ncbi:YadA C-terminal domain-containing protein [Leclercia adecarboxylata]|uniref:YadA C-terminal domain-containing protein n=1 Tax=Leclercia adecarboxylata TaxID=83655 RepID=UPI0018CCBBBB|nr:YadA C-terminal domain-containing protein [Leclercia adecarboxylata]